MATASLSTSPTQIDAGSSDNVSITNTGSVDVVVARGAQSFTLRPTQGRVVYPEGVAVTAATVSGTGSVSYTATAARLSQQAQFAADPAFTATYAIAGLPANAGTRLKRYDPARYLYNGKSSMALGIRAALAKGGIAASTLTTVQFLGDSKVAGYGTNGGVSITGTAAMPGVVRRALASRGYTIAGTGPVFAQQNTPSGDSRWVLGTGWSSNNSNGNFSTSSTNGSSITFTSDLAGTVAELWTLSNSAAFTLTVDGTSPASGVTVSSGTYNTGTGLVTPSGSSVLVKVTVTGLANTTHTVAATTTTTSATYIVAANVRGTTGLQIANHGVNGSTAGLWNSSQNFYQMDPVARAMSADAAVISLGVNDARNGISVAQYKSDMTVLLNRYVSAARPFGLIVPAPTVITQTVTQSLWDSYVSAMYDLADTFDCPLADLTDLFGSYTAANAAGLMFDTLHENNAGYAVDAPPVLAMLGL